jgi:glutaredoxin
MAVKLLRCSNLWVKVGGHPCWRVQKALDEQGIEYEVVRLPFRKGKRDHVRQVSGQESYPVIQFEDGSVYREESKDMAARIRSGKLFEGHESQTPADPPAG